MFGKLFKANPRQEAAEALYDAIVAQARQPSFYAACGVPDTLDGRFELVVLHAFLVFRRLKAEGAETAEFAQLLFNVLFRDMDRSLREIGVGDLSVGKKVRTMAEGFYGRVEAYEQGLEAAGAPHGPEGEGAEAALEAALRRNLYGTAAPSGDQVAAVAGYLRREADALANQPAAALMAGRIAFGEPPEATA